MEDRIIQLLNNKDLSAYEFLYLDSIVKGRDYGGTQDLIDWLKYEVTEKGFLNKYGKPTKKLRSLITMIKMLDYLPEKEKEIDNSVRSAFSLWWETYPKTDAHSHFLPKKGLRVDPDGCFRVYQDLLDQGYTSEQLLKALKKELNIKKQNSLRENQLSFMPTSLNYLTRKSFIPWMDEGEELPKVQVNVQVYGNLA